MNGAGSGQGRRILEQALRLLDAAQATGAAGTRPDATRHGSADCPECPDWPVCPVCPVCAVCPVCPVCRGLAYLRDVDPDAVGRLTGAVADVATAVRDLLGPAADATTTQEGMPRVRVQQIDVTD